MSKNKNMLITGVCGAIGSYLADCFLGNGYNVLGLDIVETPPNQLKQREHFVYNICDLTSGESVEKVIDSYVQNRGVVDVVINNVGLIYNSPLIHFEDGKLICHNFDDWNRVLSVSLSSAFYISAACVKHLAEHQMKGTIINVSSICAKGNPGQVAYSAAKAGLNGLTSALAKELGPIGVRVVSIAPGFLDTASTHNAVSEDKLKRIRKTIPLKRLGELEEMTHAIKFIIENNYYTGTTLELDGGLVL